MTVLKKLVRNKSTTPSTLPLLLAACGGGGERTPAPQTPNIPSDIVVDVKEFTFFQGVTISGQNTDGHFGLSASSSGDINGDGINDIMFSAPEAGPNGNEQSGETYVIFGSAEAFPDTLNLSELNGTNGFILTGINELDVSGAAISFAGDVNGDGVDDLLIGALNARGSVYESSGETYVIFGSIDSFSPSMSLSELNGTNGFTLNGINWMDRSGTVVSAIGDVNADGIDDFIISAPNASYLGNFHGGESYVVFGAAEGFPASFDLASLDGTDGFTLFGEDGGYSGNSLSPAGDVNGDGIDDFIIGARLTDADGNMAAGKAYIIFGSDSDFPALFDLSSLDGSNGFVVNGMSQNDYLGGAVSSAGDFNGDGIDDIMIGARGADANSISGAGQIYIIFGTVSGFSATFDLSSLNGLNGFVINGDETHQGAGSAVSTAGDINGDGIDDIVVGAPGATPNGNNRAGESYVIFGSRDGFEASFDLSSLDGTNGFALNGIDWFDYSGSAFSAPGDINGDGVDDLLITATGTDANGIEDAGEAYIVFGHTGEWLAEYNLVWLGKNIFTSTQADENLYGTTSGDVFDFASNWGNDLISNFEDGTDLIDFMDTGLEFSSLKITQDGSDTLIEDDSGNSLTLVGIASTDVTADDFIF